MTEPPFEPSTVHYLLVKLLSDLNLNRTLKKLRKETNCKKLKSKYIPESIQCLNYKKLLKLCNKYNGGDGFRVVNSEGDAVNTSRQQNTLITRQDKRDVISSQYYYGNDDNLENEDECHNTGDYNRNSNKRNDINQLKTMKGKDFKSQKHKKKRGSWNSSGEITNTVKSIIFDD